MRQVHRVRKKNNNMTRKYEKRVDDKKTNLKSKDDIETSTKKMCESSILYVYVCVCDARECAKSLV